MRLARSAAMVLAILAGLGWGCSEPGADPTAGDAAEEEPSLAPDFEHSDLDGNRVRLSDLRGRTVVIDFWATWCPPCIFQPTELNTFWKAHKDSGKVVVIGVEVGGATRDEVRTWAEENDAVAEYPVLLGADEDLARRFGALGFPAMIVVAPDGSIDSVHVGLTTAPEIEEALGALLVGG